jgi:hypothetical protein
VPSEERNGELANREEATMEPSFDTLARGLANGSVSRGKALRLMGAALVGGALASIPGVALAARCPSPRIRCAGQCCAAGVTTCQGTGKNKTCGPVPCPTGQQPCNGQCVATATDVANCGSCGNACATGLSCVGGACVCPQGQSECGGACTDLLTDEANCGSCGNACATGASCVDGACVCPTGQSVCGGACTDLLTDEANCNGCGNACGAGQSCVNGACVAICAAVTCCCDCRYATSATNCANGVYVTTCNLTTTTTTIDKCGDSCIANTPAGLVACGYGYSGRICFSAADNAQYICEPNTQPNQTGTQCGVVRCQGG